MTAFMYNFIGNQVPRGKTSALRHAGWELSGWASLRLSAHTGWHSLAPRAQRGDVVWKGRRGRNSDASSAPKVLPLAEGTPTLPADEESSRDSFCSLPSAQSTLFWPDTDTQSWYLIYRERLPSFSALFFTIDRETFCLSDTSLGEAQTCTGN